MLSIDLTKILFSDNSTSSGNDMNKNKNNNILFNMYQTENTMKCFGQKTYFLITRIDTENHDADHNDPDHGFFFEKTEKSND